MDHHGARLYLPTPAFRQWFNRLNASSLCRLFQAPLSDGRAIAAQLVLLGGHQIRHTVSAAVDLEHHESCASAFLRWRAFERLAALGSQGNNVTDATLNAVTHFKSQLGGELVPNPVVETTGSAVWRIGTGAERAYWGTRGRVGALLRRLRTPPSE
jgi:hypothetical protein